jgi:predicted phage terminase large subunit-like protein
MAAKLEACRTGRIKRLIINIPPRHLKSISASIALPAFWLGHDPRIRILCASYGQDLSNRLSLDCRSVMTSSWYRRLFATRLSPLKQSQAEFMTTEQGFRMATSVGGVLTGRGADVIIIDDPLKPDEAVSTSQREAVNAWYDNTLYSRLNDKRQGCILLIMQRLHLDDLVGHVLEQEPWEVVSFPAIAEEDEHHVFQTPYGMGRHHRKAGEVLHSEREPLETLALLRQTLGEYNFAGQYQQAPVPMGGGMVKTAWLLHYEQHELPDKFDQVIQSWDTANSESELSDYSVCTTWGIKEKRIYLVDVFRQRMNYPDLKRTVRAKWGEYKPSAILIEDKASGTQLIQELIQEGIYAVKGCKPEGDKVMRLHAQTATIENGFVRLPATAPWLADYINELTTFPKGKHDDQVDSTSQALSWIKQEGQEPGMIRYIKQQMEKKRQEQGGAEVWANSGHPAFSP